MTSLSLLIRFSITIYKVSSRSSPTLFLLTLRVLVKLPLLQFLGNAKPLLARGVYVTPSPHPHLFLWQHNSNSSQASWKFSGRKPSCSPPHPQTELLLHSRYLFFIELASFLIKNVLGVTTDPLPSVDCEIPVDRIVLTFACHLFTVL